MIVKLSPASDDQRVWLVSVRRDGRDVPVDFTTAPEEQRPFLGSGGGLFDAEPSAEGWEIRRRVYERRDSDRTPSGDPG